MMMKNEIRSKVLGEKQFRNLTVENSEAIDIENRTVDLAFASEEPYDRWWGTEIIDTQKMDLARLNQGGALLWNHDNRDGHIGVVESAWVDDDLVARAKVRFSKKKFADDIFNDIVDGIVKHVSFGYEITDFDLIKESEKKGELNVYKVATNSTEISMVHTPADLRVGVGRSLEHPDDVVTGSAVVELNDNVKTLEVSEMENENTTVENEVVETPTIDKEALEKAAFEKGQEARASYEKEVREMCKLAGFENEADGFLKENVNVKHVRETLVELKANADKEEVSTVRIEAGDDLKATRDQERVKQLAHLINPACEASEAYRSIRGPQALIKNIMKEHGADVSEMGTDQVIDSLLSRDHSTSDFPIILKDAANKSLLASFDAQLAVQTFRPLFRERQVADYKEINVARLGESPDLVLKPEGAEYQSGTVSETGETYKVKDYGRMISFTDRALRNDDLGAFSRGLLQFGSAAARKESDLAWGEFQNGLVEAATLYSVGRNTLHGTTALDIGGLSTLREALMTQTGLDSSAPLNLMGSYLIVPPSLLTEAQQLMNGQYVPTTAGGVNVFQGAMQVISDARLPDGAWYMAADLGQIDLFEIAYLSGRRAPQLDQRINFTTDSLDAKVKHSFAVKAIDYRGLQKATLA
jgi:hypothetical protein